MKFYDDGGVDFAEQQFADVRARKEKTAKDQDKFSRNLLVLDKLIGVGDNILNKKADKLQNEGVLARSHYISSLENSTVFNKEYNQYVQDGLNDKDILESETKDKLIAYTQEKYGEGYDISQFMDGINNIAKEYSTDESNLERYQALIDAHSKIPNMSPAEFIAYSREQDQPVRNVGEFLGNSIKKVFQSHDEETLSEEDKIAKQKTLNGMLGENFANVKVALEEFASGGNPIDELSKYIVNNPDLIAFKNANITISPSTKMVNGKTTVTNYMISTAISSDGKPVQLSPPEPTTQSTKQDAPKVYSAQALSIGQARITEWAKDESANDAEFEDNFKYMKKHFPTLLTESVLTIQDNLINNYGIPKSRALGIATKYAVGQDSSEIDTNPSMFDIDFSKGSLDTDKIQIYAESIKKVKSDVFVPYELKQMRDRLVNVVATSDSPDSQKKEEMAAIYSIMDTVYDIVPPNEFNKVATNNNSSLKTQEEKTIAQKVNDIPVIGSVNEFLFGDEYTKKDALFFLGVAGVGRTIGIKVVGKASSTAAIKIGNQILKTPSLSKFIKKATKFADPKKNPRGRELFLKNMTPVQRAIFKHMDVKGNIDTLAFMKRLSSLAGTKVVQSGVLPGIGTKIGKFGYGAVAAWLYFSEAPRDDGTYPIVDLDKDEDEG